MKLNSLMKFSKAFVYRTMLGMTGTAVSPLFTSEKHLPFKIDLPLNWRNNRLSCDYALIICSFLIYFVSTLLMIIVWYLMINSSIKYHSLGNRLSRKSAIGSKTMVVNKSKTSEAEKRRQQLKLEAETLKLFHDEFIRLVKEHRIIRESIEDLKSLFANLFLVQIVTSGICICSSIYVLAFGDNDNLLLPATYILYIIYNSFDIFMTMFFGNEIMLANGRLSYCLFESNWIEQSPACRKCIIVFGEMLKQPHQLVIGKLYPMNLVTLTSILHFAYSF